MNKISNKQLTERKNQHISDYRLIVQIDKKTEDSFSDIIHSNEFKDIVRKIILN